MSGARYRWIVLGVGAAGAGAFSALRMGLPALGPQIRHAYGLSLPQVGLAFTAVSGGVMLTLVPWGMLTDRIGERPVMAGGLAGTACALAAAAFAPGYALLLAALLLAGMLGASATGASGRAVMGWFSRAERGFALGVRQMALPLGGALSSLTLPLVAGAGGLRAALLVLAGLTATAALAAALWMREAPASLTAHRAPPLPAPPPVRDVRIWRLGAGSALLVIAQSSMIAFLVLFLHDVRGVAAAGAAAMLAAVQLTAAVARLVVGRWSDRLGRRIGPIRRLALANTTLFALVAALVHGPQALLYPLLLVAAVSSMTWNGLAFTAAAEISGRARAGTAMSIQNMVVAVGSAVAPAGFGALVAATTWTTGYAACALAPLLAFVVLAPLVDDERRRLAALTRRRRLAPAGQTVDEAAEALGGALGRRDGAAESEDGRLELLHRGDEVAQDRDGDGEVLVRALDGSGGPIDVRRDERQVGRQPFERAAQLPHVGHRFVDAAHARARRVSPRRRLGVRHLLQRVRRAVEVGRHRRQPVELVGDEALERARGAGHGAHAVHDGGDGRERECDERPESHLGASLSKEPE